MINFTFFSEQKFWLVFGFMSNTVNEESKLANSDETSNQIYIVL
jgi:hypothetical protein